VEIKEKIKQRSSWIKVTSGSTVQIFEFICKNNFLEIFLEILKNTPLANPISMIFYTKKKINLILVMNIKK